MVKSFELLKAKKQLSVQFEPEIFHVLLVSIRPVDSVHKDSGKAQIFNSGRVIITGVVDEEAAMQLIRHVDKYIELK